LCRKPPFWKRKNGEKSSVKIQIVTWNSEVVRQELSRMCDGGKPE
jgi:hypothetical protein